MKRRLVNLVTLLSLLLCVAGTVLWVRSYQIFERVYYRRPVPTHKVAEGRGPFLAVDRGILEVGWVHWEQYGPLPPAWDEPFGLHRVSGLPRAPRQMQTAV